MDNDESPIYDSSQLRDTERELVDELLTKKGYKQLFKVQQKALDAGVLRKDKNLIIIAPTASGKTLCAEFVFYKYLKNGGRVVYIVPTDSLVNDKEIEFKDYLGDEYKLTGKWNERDLLITSFESFYRRALLNTNLAEGFGMVIIDEFHILYSRNRGFTLEKIITLLKNLGLRILCLSATFEDRNEISGWLEADMIDIPNELRAVPLKQDILYVDKLVDVYDELITKKLSPYLIFCSSRPFCRSRARELSKKITRTKFRVREILNSMGKIVPRNLTLEEQLLCNFLSKGVGYHHSGLDKRIREYIQERFKDKKIDFLFATPGLAYGVNLPAHSTVLFDFRRYDSMLERTMPIEVYEYFQMAGRAGRPKWDTEGYSFIVVSNLSDKKLVESKYFEGKLEKAISHISEDAFFRKAILELIHSGRKRDEQIFDFFNSTFYNYQSETVKSLFSKFDLMGIIKSHIEYLQKNNFITYLGLPGNQLTDLGKVTMNFLFKTFSNYDLDIFIELENYVNGIDELKADIDIILVISKLFTGATLSKKSRKKVEIIERFYSRKDIFELGHAHYSAYAIWHGWMENMSEEVIENDFNVYASDIDRTTRELHSLLQFTEDLVKINDKSISNEFEKFKKRIRKGYNDEQLDFYDLKFFGRKLLGNLWRWCHDTYETTPYNYSGTMYQLLSELKASRSEKEFIRILSMCPNISGIRSKKIYDFIESRM